MRLYHATDYSAAEQIKESRRFHCGSHGFAGGAIYFSMREDGARRKYRNGKGNPDVIIKCEVDLGRLLQAERHKVNRDTCRAAGYDSVKIQDLDVYAVYDPSRVQILNFEDLRKGSVNPLQQEKQRRQEQLRLEKLQQEQRRREHLCLGKLRQEEQQREEQLVQQQRQKQAKQNENLRFERVQQEQQLRTQQQQQNQGGKSIWSFIKLCLGLACAKFCCCGCFNFL